MGSNGSQNIRTGHSMERMACLPGFPGSVLPTGRCGGTGLTRRPVGRWDGGRGVGFGVAGRRRRDVDGRRGRVVVDNCGARSLYNFRRWVDSASHHDNARNRRNGCIKTCSFHLKHFSLAPVEAFWLGIPLPFRVPASIARGHLRGLRGMASLPLIGAIRTSI